MKAMLDGKPAPFKQPFLCLQFKKDGLDQIMRIDVDGKIRMYILPSRKPTKRLLNLCRLLASRGQKILFFGEYKGSAGPNHILRDGALFSRMEKFEKGEGAEVKDFIPPKFLWHAF